MRMQKGWLIATLLTLTTPSVFAQAVVDTTAGGFSGTTIPQIAPTQPNQGIYADGLVGYGISNWSSSPALNPSNTVTNDGNGAVFGGDLGFSFNSYLGTEMGAYYIPTVNETINGGQPGTGTLDSWAAYFAGRLMFPISREYNLTGFLKVGPVFRRVIASGQPGGNNPSISSEALSGWKTLVGAGLQYRWNTDWLVSLQYLYFQGGTFSTSGTNEGLPIGYFNENNSSGNVPKVPSVNMILLGVGYFFSI